MKTQDVPGRGESLRHCGKDIDGLSGEQMDEFDGDRHG